MCRQCVVVKRLTLSVLNGDAPSHGLVPAAAAAAAAAEERICYDARSQCFRYYRKAANCLVCQTLSPLPFSSMKRVWYLRMLPFCGGSTMLRLSSFFFATFSFFVVRVMRRQSYRLLYVFVGHAGNKIDEVWQQISRRGFVDVGTERNFTGN